MRKDIERSLKLLKYLTTSCFLLMLLNCALLFFGLRQPYAEVITISIGFWIVYTEANKVFHLCLLTRVMILYVFVSMLCIWTQRYRGLGDIREYAQKTMFFIGLLISLFLVMKLIVKRYGRCRGYTRHRGG